MTENHEQIAHYPTLTDAQRQRARDRARQNLAARLGGEPRYSDFVRQTHSRYGVWAERLGLMVAGVVLIAAFTISAIHVFGVGYDTYFASSNDARTAAIIGVALVVLAEASVIALSVLPTLWNTPPRVTHMMQAGVVASAFIATVGNIDATILYTSTPFHWLRAWWSSLATSPADWMLATLPPFLTVLVGMGLKYRLLTSSEIRKSAGDAYHAALDDWNAMMTNIEDHKQWRVFWFNALWDEWVRVNGARVQFALDDDTKLAIVLREMESEDRIARILNAGGMRRNAANATEYEGKSKKDVALDYLRNNPELARDDQTNIAAIITNATGIQISQSTVSRALSAFSENGHSEN